MIILMGLTVPDVVRQASPWRRGQAVGAAGPRLPLFSSAIIKKTPPSSSPLLPVLQPNAVTLSGEQMGFVAEAQQPGREQGTQGEQLSEQPPLESPTLIFN